MKAIALVSGGLDSTLAMNLIRLQGIEIIALNFKTPFCLCDRGNAGCISHSHKAASSAGVELKVINITEDFFPILKKPKHGYGSNMNPCIDCRILKFKKAKEFMSQAGASFIITGEVLGQRPMSQHRQALKIIDKESCLEGLVLRPLSAKLLEETIPEKSGWVLREKLLAFNGRSRKPQIALAEKFNIKDYPCPAGGCLLTDPEFSMRLKDLMLRQNLDIENIELLKVGRHFRLSEKIRLVVGRNEAENNRLINLAKDSNYLFRPLSIPGPTALLKGAGDEGLINLSCAIVSRYCDLNGKNEAEIVYNRVEDRIEKSVVSKPMDEDSLRKFRI
ncbi:MAG: tRNA 4-thiouridine(8) synthase ThiI [Candidatus Omnitrophota bacterium]|nr:tRNA 4-thiouridine(8) synthase ThiI [Candidatus Omnitrophota bacterium]